MPICGDTLRDSLYEESLHVSTYQLAKRKRKMLIPTLFVMFFKKGTNIATSRTPVVLNNFAKLCTSGENEIKALQNSFLGHHMFLELTCSL